MLSLEASVLSVGGWGPPVYTQMGKGGFEFRVVLPYWVRIIVTLVLFLGVVMVLWLCLKGK